MKTLVVGVCLAMLIFGFAFAGSSTEILAQSAQGSQSIQGNQDNQGVFGMPRACRLCMRNCTGACTVAPGCACIFERLPDDSAMRSDTEACSPPGIYSSEYNACVLVPED